MGGLLAVSVGLLWAALEGAMDDPSRACREDERTAGKARNAIGINLDGLSDWGRAWMFVDAFKQARPWSIGSEAEGPEGGRLDVDESGHVRSLLPGQTAKTYLFTDADGHYPGGRYVAEFDGEGELRWSGDARLVKAAPGRALIEVDPGNGIRVELVRSSPDDPLRNLSIFMPGFGDGERTSHFHPTFMKRLRHFSVLRFMDLQRTNGSPLERWEQRARPSDATQTSRRGVALEYLLDLTHELPGDPWFSIPHGADDDFIRQFALQVRESLPKGRRVFIEYSNEVWNTLFEQAAYARSRGLDLGLSDDPYEAQLRFYSRRSLEMFRIWEDVFGGPERLVRVLASHFANLWVSRTILDWNDAYREADALAVAPYFGQRLGSMDWKEAIQNRDVDHLLAACRREVEKLGAQVEETASLARRKGLRLVAYEAGQHLATQGVARNNLALAAFFESANRDPVMGDIYREYLNIWHKRGGELAMLFSFVSKPSKWGSWGLLEWQDQLRRQAPKFDAVLDYLGEVGDD
jgi:hypothetical protein